MPTFDTPEPISVTIDIGGGHVLLRASDRTDTFVDVRPTDENASADVENAEQTQVDYANGRLVVRAPKNRLRSIFGQYPSIDVTIDLPAGSDVDAKALGSFRSEGRLGDSSFDTAAGYIRLDQTGRLKVHTGAGDVAVGRSSGHTEATLASGKVWIGGIDGTAAIKTSNGEITLGEANGDVRLNTANGDITVDRVLADVNAKTAYGNVRIGEVVRGSLSLETGFGEMEVGVREGTAAWLDVNSKHGRVRSDLEAGDSPGESEETAEVRARTNFGDIVIRRSWSPS